MCAWSDALFQIVCICFSQWFLKRKGPFLWAWLPCDQYMVEPCFQIAYMSCPWWYICDWAFCPDFPYVLCNFALWSKCMIRMLLCLIMLYIYIYWHFSYILIWPLNSRFVITMIPNSWQIRNLSMSSCIHNPICFDV